MALMHLLLMTIFVFYMEQQQRNYLRLQNHKETESLANSIAVNASFRMQANDVNGLEEIVKSLDNYPGLKYAMIMSNDQVVLAHTQKIYVGTKLLDSVSRSLQSIPKMQELNVSDRSVHDIAAPVLNSMNEIIGWVRIVEEQKNIYHEMFAISRAGILYILIVIFCISLFASFIGKVLTKGIYKLLYITGEIRSGKSDVRVPPSGSDEIDKLGTGINKMLDEIDEKSAQLNSINDNLPDSIVYQATINADGQSKYLYLSKVIERYIGKPVAAAMQDANVFIDLLHKDDRERYCELRRKVIQNNTEFVIEVRISTYKGELRWMNVHAIPRRLEDGTVVWDGVFTDITERKNTEEALRKSEALFRSFVENANDIIYTITLDSKLTYASPNCKELLGHKVSDYIGLSVFDTMLHPDDHAVCRVFMEKVFLTGQKQASVEHRIKSNADGWRWYSTNASPIFNEQGKIISFLGIARDITERKQAEDALRKSEELFRSFVENANDTVFSITPLGILTYGSPNWTNALGYDVSEYIGKSVFETLIHQEDIPGCMEKMQEAMLTGEKQSGIEYRILHKDGNWRWQTANASPIFDEKGAIVSFLGIARDITEQKINEAVMRSNAQSYFDLFNTITEAIYIQDEYGVFIDVNNGVEKMYGYSREEVIGKTPEFLSAAGKNDLMLIQQIVAKTFTSGQSQQFEFWGQRKNGAVFPKDVICNKGRYFGKDVIITTARDITQRKLAEDALKESEEKFSKVFHLSPDVILLSRITDGVIVDVNERAFDLAGYKREEVIGMTTMALNGWEDIAERSRYVNMLNRDGRVVNFYKLFKTKSGETKNTTISGELLELKGEKFILTVIHDITDRIKAEEEIKERATQLQMLGDNLPDTMIYQYLKELDGTFRFTYLSKEVEKITGVPAEAVIEDPAILFKLTYPQDIEKIKREEEVSFRTMSAFNVDVRIYNSKDELRWHNISSVPRKLTDGRVLWDGVQTDITERKLADEKIKESEEKYRSLISQASDAIVIYSLDGTIHEFNHSAYKSVGYTMEEFGKLKLNNFLLDYTFMIDSEATKKMQKGETFSFSRQLKKKDGSIIDADFNARLLDDKKILAFIRDVTDKKEAERKIRESGERYQQLFTKTPMPVWLYEVGSLNIIDVNEAAVNHYGYTRDEFLKMRITDIRPESDLEKLADYFKHTYSGLRFAGLWKHKKKDGSMIDVEVSSHDFNFNQKRCRIVLVNDITEKLAAERKLAESEIKYRTMIEHNQAGIYQTTLDGRILNCNNAFVKMLGYASKEELMKEDVHNLYFYNIHREEFLALLKVNNELNNYEITLKHKDGQSVHMIENCFLRKDIENGEEIIEGTVIDISERKKAEEALKGSLKEISDYKYALDQSSIVSITDEKGLIKHVNDNFCLLYGYTKEEAIGFNHSKIINSGYHPKTFWKNFWSHIQTGKVLKAEVCNRSKSGALHWGDTTIIPFLGEDGKPYQYLAIRSDITAKRKLEKELTEQQIHQQKLITEMTIAAQEKERNELGRELHDNINQILATVKIYLGMAKIKNSYAGGLNLVEQSYDYVNEAMEEIRKLSHSLVAPSLGDIGLHEALEELVQEINITGVIQAELKYEIDKSQMIDDKEELMLYRVVQEQVNNIRKYAKAKKVMIDLKQDEYNQYLIITDDGVGFDTGKKAKGIGLKNIQSRVEFYSGNLTIISSPGNGCALEISIPQKK